MTIIPIHAHTSIDNTQAATMQSEDDKEVDVAEVEDDLKRTDLAAAEEENVSKDDVLRGRAATPEREEDNEKTV
jgi:hypothetical protein